MPNPTFQATVGRFLIRVRESLGVTQAQFAERLGVEQSTLSRLQKGEQNLTAETLDRILDRLGMDVGALCRSLLNHELKRRGRPPASTPGADEE